MHPQFDEQFLREVLRRVAVVGEILEKTYRTRILAVEQGMERLSVACGQAL